MIIKSSQHKLQVKPLHHEEAVVYRVGGGGGEFAQGSPGSWGQGWCSQVAGTGWECVPTTPQASVRILVLSLGTRAQISLKTMRCSDDGLVTGRRVTGPDKGEGRGGSIRGLVLTWPEVSVQWTEGPNTPSFPWNVHQQGYQGSKTSWTRRKSEYG